MKKFVKSISFFAIALIVLIFSGADCSGNVLKNQVIPTPTSTMPGGYTKEDAIKVVANLANVFVAPAATIALIVLIYGAILYLVSAGNQAQAEKAKNTMIYAVIGLVVIILAYVIITFVINTVFLGKNPSGG